ncbi:hypothetical protein Pecwa_3726 [Pectobacterium parmentieri WPP163]|uniref:Uncharacterized protein n=1 Tax=Pectobacterium parmentieri TaxID=1905730 RepID=A0A0H3I7G9_PECPM|nr:hypothetical protein Pecwa_3726 [Pectobacterium parmentieri WPP163]AFI91930.1 Hypothetical protein W5S_3867 [Pectobacterium parmentieri]
MFFVNELQQDKTVKYTHSVIFGHSNGPSLFFYFF